MPTKDQYVGMDPLHLLDTLWPDVRLYREQKLIIRSVWENNETYVPAANMMGKDFVSGFIVLAGFLTRIPCRIVTTSAKDDHLSVLWGEINRFIQRSRIPLLAQDGGPLVVHHRSIKRKIENNNSGAVELCPISYVMGMVAGKDSIAAMQGHHANPDKIDPTNKLDWYSLFVGDESSSLMDEYYTMAVTWANRLLSIGNTWPCHNFYRRAVKAGDLPRVNGKGYYRKIIRIKAEDSPNVRFAMNAISRGLDPGSETIIPGVISYEEYIRRRHIYDEIQQKVSLDAEFYEGDEIKLCPTDWIQRSEALWVKQKLNNVTVTAKYMGVDTAEGGDNTSWCIIGDEGVVELFSLKTTDTSVIVDQTIQFIRDFKLDSKNVIFDSGGGGQVSADHMRRRGFKVRAVSFGESAAPETRKKTTPSRRKIMSEDQKHYKNRRAQLFDCIRQLLNKSIGSEFSIPRNILDKPRVGGGANLRQQLEAIPLLYDEEGKMYLPPKRRKNNDDKRTTMTELCGCSPDEADSFALAAYAKMKPVSTRKIGVAV